MFTEGEHWNFAEHKVPLEVNKTPRRHLTPAGLSVPMGELKTSVLLATAAILRSCRASNNQLESPPFQLIIAAGARPEVLSDSRRCVNR